MSDVKLKLPLHCHGVEAHHRPMLVASYWQELEDQDQVREISGGLMTSLRGAEGSCREVGSAPASCSEKKEMAERFA